jgi:hypothetical protein
MQPPQCTHCKTFGHKIISCTVRPQTDVEIAAMNAKVASAVKEVNQVKSCNTPIFTDHNGI